MHRNKWENKWKCLEQRKWEWYVCKKRYWALHPLEKQNCFSEGVVEGTRYDYVIFLFAFLFLETLNGIFIIDKGYINKLMNV